MLKSFVTGRSTRLLSVVAMAVAVNHWTCLTGHAIQETVPPATGAAQDPQAGETTGLSGAENKPLPEDRQRAIEFLVNEMAQLTPGKLSDNTALNDAYKAAAGNLVDEKMEESLEGLKAAQATNPDMPPANLLMAAMFFAGGNPQQGFVYLELAAADAPDFPLVYVAFARIAISQQRKTDARVLLEKAGELLTAGNWSEAVQGHLLENNLDALADLQILASEYPEARTTLEKILERKPDYPRGVLRMAEVAYRQENIDEALTLLKSYTGKEKDSRAAELMMATFFQRDGKTEDAAKWIQDAYANHPEDVTVLTEYAAWRVNREEFNEANLALSKIEQQVGKMPIPTLLKAKMAFAQQAYELAESRFAELNRLEPANAEIANLWAMSLAESSSSDKLALALEQAQRNMQAQPQNPFAATVLGWVYFRQKNYEQANVWFSRAAQSSNLPPEAAYYFAKFLQHLGEKEKALELIDGALKTENLFLYRNAAITLKAVLSAGDQSLKTPGGN